MSQVEGLPLFLLGVALRNYEAEVVRLAGALGHARLRSALGPNHLRGGDGRGRKRPGQLLRVVGHRRQLDILASTL